jgi:hypothetical protein
MLLLCAQCFPLGPRMQDECTGWAGGGLVRIPPIGQDHRGTLALSSPILGQLCLPPWDPDLNSTFCGKIFPLPLVTCFIPFSLQIMVVPASFP